MRSTYAFLLALPLIFTQCKAIKTIKILKKGEVAQKNYKEEVSFESRAGLILLKVQVNKKDYNFIFDSGAPNCVTKELAKELGLIPVVDQKAVDAEGKTGGIEFVQVNEIALGKITFLNTAAAVIDLKQVPELACLKVDGLIGANLMRKACWQLDYVKKTIVFSSSLDSLRVPPAAASMSFSPELSGTPIVEVELENLKVGGNIFDTGSTGNITLSASAFKKLQKQNPSLKYLKGVGSNSAGLYGQGFDTSYLAKTDLKMGSLPLPGRVVEFKRDKGNLGSDFFREFVVTMDWGKKKIYFVPQPAGAASWKTFGFSSFKNKEKLLVSFLIENSPAALAGLRQGDEILSINGKSYANLSAEEYCGLIVNSAPWLKEDKLQITVKQADGSEKTVTVEKAAMFD
jgi:hypothetical protein